MSSSDYIRIIAEGIDPKPFLDQIQKSDWKWMNRTASADPDSYGGDFDPPGFLPLCMGVADADDTAAIKNSERLQRTEMYDRFTEVHKFWKQWGFTEHARAAFFKLKPGGTVGKHIDDGTYYLNKDRYHLALQGTYRYRVGNYEMIVNPGTFFWFHNKEYHGAWNIGEVDRISLVFDAPHSPNNPQWRIK